MCSNIEGKESNEVDAREGQEFVLGDKALMSQTYSTFTIKKNKLKVSKCYRVLSCIKSNKFKPK